MNSPELLGNWEAFKGLPQSTTIREPFSFKLFKNKLFVFYLLLFKYLAVIHAN